MLAVFNGVKDLLKCKRLHIDHCVFRLHYKISVFLLLAFSALVGSKQYAGEPIKCSNSVVDLSTLVEIYCYITSTYTVEKALNKTPAEGVPHPGVYPSQNEAEFRYHTYYQWVGFLLFLQAMLFYFPHWLWKSLEGGQLVRLLDRKWQENSAEDRLRHRNHIVEAIRYRWAKERLYCVKYFFCEFLCLVNVIGQLFLMDQFFSGDYLSYGVDAVRFLRVSGPPGRVVSPFNRLFPKVTSCTYRYFGEGGSVNRESMLCVLAVNAVNEKIFLFLWFWVVSLCVLTAVALAYKGLVFSMGSLRLALLRANFRNVRREDLRFVVENGNMGDYLFVYLLGQNMDPVLFHDVIAELTARLQIQMK